uniref:Uncharacterized protein n=1 Tax=Oryza sativa subsp. japonica TaxID=39947 RepID=Q69XS9_ORYSJ|nr:hypothetical protein [Oryza sativa Japonica Group]
MEQPTIQNLSAPRVDLFEPSCSSQPILSDGYEISPGFIARDEAKQWYNLSVKKFHGAGGKRNSSSGKSIQFEEDLFDDCWNTSNYSYDKRPPTKVNSNDPLDKAMLKETVKKLTTIMSNKWLRGGELS